MPLEAGTSPLSHQFLLLLSFLGILLYVIRARAELGFILTQGLTSLADCSDLTSARYVAFGECGPVAPGDRNQEESNCLGRLALFQCETLGYYRRR